MDITAPDWTHCGDGATGDEPVGCTGIRIGGFQRCLGHLGQEERHAHLATLTPGDDIDARGTEISGELLDELLDALCRPGEERPRCGRARFDKAVFTGAAHFNMVCFDKGAWFREATFRQDAVFAGAIFGSAARFDGAEFHALANFDEVRCPADGTTPAGHLVFRGASFATGPWFMGAHGVRLLDLRESHITRPTVAQVVAEHVDFTGAWFEAPVTLKASGASVDLTRARLAERCTLTSMEHHVAHSGIPAYPTAPDQRPSVTSLSGVDASMLLLFDVDLSRCVFAGTHHLDQLQIEGSCVFAEPPRGRRWTRRHVIVEEAWWRGWQTPGPAPYPAALADTYRQLRKAREDARDEPGAADFYYGEMEMRRHSRTWSEADRWLLQAYWLLSGYGLRASRALGWLAASMLLTIVLLTGFGLPQGSPKQEATATVPPPGGKVTFEIDKEDPENPTGDRFTGKRLEKALEVTLNSTVFRSGGQDLTVAGGYIEMASRFSEPVLLGLAALAIRGRMKR
ncbi:pentapeptide repeat-containing protein [Streptomyces sp. 6N106]|uniref:pentapeptide repeat-containing protein n=1 Tax=Streptomyces sp. 6N106 TaxID=3457418 RepID=UPI003FD3AB65